MCGYGCQLYKSVDCCPVNATVGPFCTVVEPHFIPLLTVIIIKYYEFLSVFLLLSGMHIAYVLHCIILSVTCLAVSHIFPHYLINGMI